MEINKPGTKQLIDGLLLLARSENEVSRKVVRRPRRPSSRHRGPRATPGRARSRVTVENLRRRPLSGNPVLPGAAWSRTWWDNGVRHNVERRAGWVRVSSRTGPRRVSAVVEGGEHRTGRGPALRSPHALRARFRRPKRSAGGDRPSTGPGWVCRFVRAGCTGARRWRPRGTPAESGGLTVDRERLPPAVTVQAARS